MDSSRSERLTGDTWPLFWQNLWNTWQTRANQHISSGRGRRYERRYKGRYGNVCVSGSVWPVTGETAPPHTCLSPSSFRTSMTTRPCFNLKVCIIALQHPWSRTGRLLLHRNSLDIQHSRAQCVKSEDKTRRGEGGMRNILCKLIRWQYIGIVSPLTALSARIFSYFGNFLDFETFSSCRQLKSFYNLLCFYCQYIFKVCLHAISDDEAPG